MTSKSFLSLLLLILGFNRLDAQETTVTLSPSLDTYVASEFPTTDNSSLDRTYSYYYGYSYRIFIDFDLSSIPDDAIVTSATLKMYCPWVNNAASHPYYLQRASSDWGGASKTWNNQPSVVTSDQISITHTQTQSIGWHNFDVLSHVQYMVNYPVLNYGWCMRLQSESGTTRGNKYWSQEYVNTSLRPVLEVKYVMPIEISATVTHSGNGLNNGVIDAVQVNYGSGTYSQYEWFNISGGTYTSIESGTNFANIDVDNLVPGAYILTVQDDLGYTGYQYFLVGEEGATTTVEIYANDLTTSQNYNEDAMVDDYPTYVNTNYGNYGGFYTFNNYYSAIGDWRDIRSFVKYELDFDPQLDFQAAEYRVFCAIDHYKSFGNSNQSYVSRITQDWTEELITYNTKPTVTTQNQVTIPETPVVGYYSRDDVIDILDFVKYWQINPNENYGFELALSSYTNSDWVRLFYGSSDWSSSATERPRLYLQYTVINKIYATPKRTLEGGYFKVPDHNIMFIEFYEEYDIPSNLDYKIYNFQGKEMVSTYGLSTISEEFGDNRFKIDVSPLPQGAYVLEIKNDKKETWYLRFKKA